MGAVPSISVSKNLMGLASCQVGELQLGCRLVFLMSFCEYVGNGVKDLVCAPRPMGHPKGAGKTKLLLSQKRGREDANIHSLVSRPMKAAKLP